MHRSQEGAAAWEGPAVALLGVVGAYFFCDVSGPLGLGLGATVDDDFALTKKGLSLIEIEAFNTSPKPLGVEGSAGDG